MSDTPPATDEFAAAKANLRDTVKWLVTVLAALAAAIVGTAPLGGLASLAGWRLWVAGGAGLAGFSAILIAVGVLRDILLTARLASAQVRADADLVAWLNEHAADLLPVQCATLDAFFKARDDLVATLRRLRDDQGSEAYRGAEKAYRVADVAAGRILGLASFERLRRRIARRLPWLFALAVAAFLGLAVFTGLASAKKDAAEPLKVEVSMAAHR